MRFNFKLTFLFILFLIFFLKNDAQERGYRNKCELISAFINSESVVKFFNLDTKYADTLLTVIDIFNGFDNCEIYKWHTNKLDIVNKGPLADSLKRWEPYYVLKNRCGYFLFLADRPGNDDHMSIVEGCSNLISTVKIIKKKKHFFLGKISNGIM